MVPAQRNNSVTLLRLVAAFLVLSGHMSRICGITPIILFGEQVHSMGVKIFFLLGGVFITQSWQKDPHPLRYAVKRFFRIWPPLAVYVLIAAFVIGPIFTQVPLKDYFTSPVLGGYLNNLRLYMVYTLPGLFGSNPCPNEVNGSLWTLPVETAMYLMVPLFCILQGKIKDHKIREIVAWGVAILAYVGRLVLNTMPGETLIIYATDWFAAMDIIPFYFVGMAYAHSDLKKYLNVPLALLLMMVFCALGLEGNLRLMAFFLLFSYLILSMAFGVQISSERIPFHKLEISYGIYLWGFFVQQLFEMQLIQSGFKLPFFTVQLMICTTISIAMGWLNYLVVEEPAQKVSKKVLCLIQQRRIKKKHNM